MRPAFIVLIILSIIVATAPSYSIARTWHVPVEAPTIQAGIDSAEDGDIVSVYGGFYTGPGNRDLDFGGKRITVESTGTAVIYCQELGRGFFFHSGESEASVVSGFFIMGGLASGSWPNDSGGAIYCCNYSSPTIRNCTFSGNEASWFGGAISCRGYSSPVIDGCVFEGNTALVGGGFSCELSSSPMIKSCTFYGQSAVNEGGGLALADNSHPVLESTIISFGTDGEAVYCDGTSGAALSCCDLYGNAGGDWVGSIADQLGENGNFSEDPDFCQPEEHDFTIWSNSPCARGYSPSGCDLVGALEVGCVAPYHEWHVPGDAPTIQAAIDSSLHGDVVIVHPGVYTGEGNRDLDFGGKNITVRAQRGPNYTIIDCENLGRGFDFHSGENFICTVEGFTIINGTSGSGPADDSGGAVWCRDGSSPTIRRCVMRNNSVLGFGGAIACHYESHPIIEESIFDGNQASSGGGIACMFSSNPALSSCTFYGNAADPGGGGGIACYGSSNPQVDHTIISFSTDGEGVYCEPSSGATLTCSDVYGNAGGDWVGCIAGQFGLEGNIGEDPLLCSPSTGNFRLRGWSPCSAWLSECGLIGALAPGCWEREVMLGAQRPDGKRSRVVPGTWGAVKSIFRTPGGR